MNVTNRFVDPTSLSLPSPSDSTSVKRAVSSTPDSHEEGPSRKRPRSDATSDERKEARMHRNRIAAQNSRDRRKAQFTYLEQRVAELEEENRQLRASLGVQGVTAAQARVLGGREKGETRDRENEELRERIRTLERGWEAVIKALASQGLPTGLLLNPSTPTSKPESSTSALHTIIPSSPVFPLSPAPSNSSPMPSPGPLTDGVHRPNFDAPAAGEVQSSQFNGVLETAAQPLPLTTTPSSIIDEAAMDNLFREILTDPPSSASVDASPSLVELQIPSFSAMSSDTSATQVTSPLVVSVEDWEQEEEMRKLLDLLPDVQTEGLSESVEFTSSLDLELCPWDVDNILQPSSSSQLGVF